MSLQGIRCPKCGGSDLQGIRLAYENSVREEPSGSSDEQTGVVVALLLAHELLSRVWHGYEPLPGNSRSLLADRIHPPLQKSYIRAIIWGALAAGGILLTFSVERRGWLLLILTIPLAIKAWNSFESVTEYNRTEWLVAYKKWESMCLCKRCGQVIDPT